MKPLTPEDIAKLAENAVRFESTTTIVREAIVEAIRAYEKFDPENLSITDSPDMLNSEKMLRVLATLKREQMFDAAVTVITLMSSTYGSLAKLIGMDGETLFRAKNRYLWDDAEMRKGFAAVLDANDPEAKS